MIYTQISSWGILEQLQLVKSSEKTENNIFLCHTHCEVQSFLRQRIKETRGD